jgi:hypothetical protein
VDKKKQSMPGLPTSGLLPLNAPWTIGPMRDARAPKMRHIGGGESGKIGRIALTLPVPDGALRARWQREGGRAPCGVYRNLNKLSSGALFRLADDGPSGV